jgi:hypothetical protein
VYAEDVIRDISMMDEIVAKWESNLDPDQKLFLLIMRTTILPQLILKTKAVKRLRIVPQLILLGGLPIGSVGSETGRDRTGN